MKDKVIIIAEAGVNHNGSLELAKKLAEQAMKSGADCVKFQTFKTENLVTINAKKADYQIENTGKNETQYSMLKQLELSYDDFIELKEYCDELGINFISTPFDFESIDFLNSIDMKFWKIPSGEITNYPYLVKIAETGKPIILSTGMSTLKEVEEAVGVLKENGAIEIKIMHCTTNYPTAFEDVNLAAIKTLADSIGGEVGYSDHTEGIYVPIAAVAMGATIIEKHFTLDRNMEGPDHKASLEPLELKTMIEAIRKVEKAIGDGEKKPAEAEKRNMGIVRKSIVASKNISAGEILSEDNLTTKRPGNGISPMKWKQVIGTKAIRDFKMDELIDVKLR